MDAKTMAIILGLSLLSVGTKKATVATAHGVSHTGHAVKVGAKKTGHAVKTGTIKIAKHQVK